jgi:hypothetical protein
MRTALEGALRQLEGTVLTRPLGPLVLQKARVTS